MHAPPVHGRLIVYYTPARRQKTVRNMSGVGQKLQTVSRSGAFVPDTRKAKLPIPAGMGSFIIRMQAEVSRLRARPKGFPIIVAPLSTSAFGGLATGEASPFGNLRGRPLAAILFTMLILNDY